MNDRSDRADDTDPFDLRALDPDMDPLAADRFAGAVMSRIARSAALPTIPPDPLFGLWSMAPVFFIAASIVIVASRGCPSPLNSPTIPVAAICSMSRDARA